MVDPHVYTGKELRAMRDTAFNMAQVIFEKHLPNADTTEQGYRIELLEYAESLAQTYIMAGVSPGELTDEYYRVKGPEE